MDSDISVKAGKRLQIIEGQVRGLQRLVAEEADCVSVLTQMASVQNALRGVARLLVDRHLRTCVSQAIKRSEADGAAHIDELLDIIYNLNK